MKKFFIVTITIIALIGSLAPSVYSVSAQGDNVVFYTEEPHFSRGGGAGASRELCAIRLWGENPELLDSLIIRGVPKKIIIEEKTLFLLSSYPYDPFGGINYLTIINIGELYGPTPILTEVSILEHRSRSPFTDFYLEEGYAYISYLRPGTYACYGNCDIPRYGGILIVDVTDTENPIKVGTVEFENADAFSVSVFNGTAFIKTGDGHVLVDVKDPQNPYIINQEEEADGNCNQYDYNCDGDIDIQDIMLYVNDVWNFIQE